MINSKLTNQETDIVIIGAGIAGLLAASELKKSGHRVVIVDKGRGVGGRLATRRIGQATFDHGAQFITARHPRFVAAIQEWEKAGVVSEWYRNSNAHSEGHPRWRGNPAMTAIAKNLAKELTLLLEKRVVSLGYDSGRWKAIIDNNEKIFANSVILTPPVPQSLELMKTGKINLSSQMKNQLMSITYAPCIAVMAIPDAPVKIPSPGGFAPKSGPIGWIADNYIKKISSIPAVTIHATASFSIENWNSDRIEIGKELLRAAEPFLESDVLDYQVHGWRYSKPIGVAEKPCLILSESPPLIIAGDAFGGPSVEGAALSGWEAAASLSKIIHNRQPASP